jgi:parallel beta-helix repeat protein
MYTGKERELRMERQLFSAFFVISLLTSMLGLAFNTRPGKAEGETIYIRADGSIDPPDAPISTVDNVTYTLTGNITSDADGIVVERSNIIIAGTDYTVEGASAWDSKGINLTGRSNVTIKNLEIKRFFHGIYANSSNYNSIHGNNITENGYGGGIALRYSLNNIVYANNITDIQGGGILLEWSSGNNVSCNNIMTNMTNDGWGMGIASSSNNILSGNNILTNYRGGIYLGNSSDNSIAGNNITENNGGGVLLDFYSSNNIVSRNAITKNGGHGIINAQGSNITISENNIRNNNQSGVLLGTSSYLSYNVVSGNNITNNKDGISLAVLDDCNNFISENNIADNSEAGIQIIPLHGAPKNILYHNNFVNNTLHINFTGAISSIKWDNGYPSGGNYWSDYTGIDANGDGLGDTPYVIDADNQDRYPLMRPWSSLPVHNMNTGLGYAAIQAAINANETLDGHTIFVEAGIYSERLSVNKTINLIGEGRAVTIIDGFEIRVTADNVMVSGFAIGGFTAFVQGMHGNGVRLEADGCTVDNNTIFNASPYGIWLLNSTNSVISNNVMIANDYNIRLDESSNNTISQNFIGSIEWKGFIRLVYGGIELYNSPNNTVTQNNVTQCKRAISMEGPSFQLWASNNTISQNNIEYDGFSGGWGMRIDRSSNNTIVENNVTERSPGGPRMREGVGMSLSSSHFNIIAQNRIEMNGEGLTLSDSHFNLIIQNNATDNLYGLQVSSSAWNLINQNHVADNYFGMLIGTNYPDYNNTLRNNEMTGNTYNFGVEGSFLDGLDVDTTNTVDGKPIYYWVNKRDDQIPPNAGYVAIVNSTNIRVEGLDIRNNYQGILIANSNDITILHNNVTNNRYGILLESSINNTISENDVTNNSYDGISLKNSRDNYMYKNRIMNPYATGIFLDWSSNNSLSQNTISNSTTGISLHYSSDNNTISGNTLAYNYVNVWFVFSSHNTIYHNNFCNYTQQAGFYSDSQENIWDNGYPSGGNYWDDCNGTDLYTGRYQNKTGSDGISDTSYVIDANNTDHYPLMNPYVFLLGDLNHDVKVNLKDVMAAVQAFNSFPGQPRWNPDADIDNNGRVDMRDLLIIVLNFNKHE